MKTFMKAFHYSFLFIFSFTFQASSQQEYENAIELLKAFKSEVANYNQSLFQYSEDVKIIDIEIHTAGNESATAKYTDEEIPWKQVNNILRLKTADGYEGISGVDTYLTGEFDQKTFKELKSISSTLLSLTSLDPVVVGKKLRQKYPELSNETLANVDIALWDLASRKAKMPLHELLGSNRNSIEGYASLPFYETLPEYINAVEKYSKLGFKTFKFHVWGNFDQDKKLIQKINKEYTNTDFRFMIDFEYAHNLQDTIKLAESADETLFILFEGPIDDKLLDQYADLNKAIPMMLIPAGYDNYSKEFILEAIRKKSWDAARFDVTVVGGLTAAIERMIITEAAEIPVEVQGWGHSLGQAVNLHLMLANDRTSFFEAPMPKDVFEFATKNGNLFKNGKIEAPKKVGLGIEVDWDKLKTADYYCSFKSPE